MTKSYIGKPISELSIPKLVKNLPVNFGEILGRRQDETANCGMATGWPSTNP